MGDLGMELDAIESPRPVGYRGEFGIVGMADLLEAGWQLRNVVAVAHPADSFIVESLEQVLEIIYEEFGMPVFAFTGFNHFTAEHVRHRLHAVADAQDRDTQFEYLFFWFGRTGAVYRGGAPGKDKPFRA